MSSDAHQHVIVKMLYAFVGKLHSPKQQIWHLMKKSKNEGGNGDERISCRLCQVICRPAHRTFCRQGSHQTQQQKKYSPFCVWCEYEQIKAMLCFAQVTITHTHGLDKLHVYACTSNGTYMLFIATWLQHDKPVSSGHFPMIYFPLSEGRGLCQNCWRQSSNQLLVQWDLIAAHATCCTVIQASTSNLPHSSWHMGAGRVLNVEQGMKTTHCRALYFEELH